MGRREVHTEDMKIEQKGAILGSLADRSPEIVLADPETMKSVAADLAFNEEPVTIRLEPSSEKNAAKMHYVAVNGKGAEVFMNGGWVEMAYLPVNRILITKRKYVAVLATAKFDTVTTQHADSGQGESEFIDNRVDRQTSAVASFSVIEDKNPKGAVWLQELRRRNF